MSSSLTAERDRWWHSIKCDFYSHFLDMKRYMTYSALLNYMLWGHVLYFLECHHWLHNSEVTRKNGNIIFHSYNPVQVSERAAIHVMCPARLQSLFLYFQKLILPTLELLRHIYSKLLCDKCSKHNKSYYPQRRNRIYNSLYHLIFFSISSN